MKPFWTILKKAGIATISITTLYGVFTYLDGIKDSQADILETVGYINIELTFQSNDIAGIKDTLKDIIDFQSKQGEQMTDMENAAKFYIRNQKQMTDDAMQDAVETILKKNLSLDSHNFPDSIQRELEWQREWNNFIDYALITEPVTLKPLRNQLTP